MIEFEIEKFKLQFEIEEIKKMDLRLKCEDEVCEIEFRRKEISWLKIFESEYNEVNAFEDKEI